jgi:hypothetical protein
VTAADGETTDARAEVARRGLVAAASAHLTGTIAVHLPFESLGGFKTLLKRYFAGEPWTEADATALSELVVPHVAVGAWEVELVPGLTMRHGVRDGTYRLTVEGTIGASPTIWDRVFDGPIRPEPTPHPQKVKFTFGGEAAPGVWYLAGDDPPDVRVRRLLDEDDVTDVMVAGSFVTVGLRSTSSWEDRLDDFLALVGDLFTARPTTSPTRTRDELIGEGRSVSVRVDRLHLLDPDDPPQRRRLLSALEDDDARVRRIAVAVLSGSSDPEVAGNAIVRGRADSSLLVRRMAVDAAGDAEDERHRPALESALEDPDPWTRWRAVRALGDLGVEPSRGIIAGLTADPDFQVRFEIARVLHGDARWTQPR